MSPEINIKISFEEGKGQVEIREEQDIEVGDSVIDADVKFPDSETPDIDTDVPVPSDEVMASDTVGVPNDSAEELSLDIITVPDDFLSDESITAPGSVEDTSGLTTVPAANYEEVNIPTVDEPISKFIADEGNIPPVPDEDFSDAVESQIIAQLDDMESGTNVELAQVPVPEQELLNGFTAGDQEIPPTPEV